MMRVERQAAFLLHRRAYRESSFLVELLTRDCGRIAAVARGARGARRAMPGVCQPLLVGWSGRGELKTLIMAEPVGSLHLPTDERLYGALYVNELLLRLLPVQDPHPVVFDAYAALLERLAQGEVLEPLLRSFELALLRELGYGLVFDRDAGTGQVLEPGGIYRFDPADGFHRVSTHDAGPHYPGHVLAAMGRGDFSDIVTRRYAKRLLRRALGELLGPRPLRSRNFFAGPRPTRAEP